MPSERRQFLPAALKSTVLFGSLFPGDLRGRAFISADGGYFDVLDGDVLRVCKAEHRTLIAHVGEKAFYDIVFEKLGEAKQ